MQNFREKFRYPISHGGFSLMEVLIAMIIFAIGMLALASLQGALTRSTAEAKVRTTAINIAERIIEGQRGFALVSSGTEYSYADISDVTSESPVIFDSEMTRNPDTVVGIEYTVTQDVKDYYYDLTTDSYYSPEDPPLGAITSDYKTVLVTVAWDDDRNFVIDEGRQTTGNLGGGSVQVSATISKLSSVGALKVSEEEDGDLIAPLVSYTPGLNPEIVSLSLGTNKFKESLQPLPKVTKKDDNVETRFDVITYSNSNGNASFLRREEFAAVSCNCILKQATETEPYPDADPLDQFGPLWPGKRPSVWAGDEYTEPESVTGKDYGVVDSSVQQSSLCSICCRDHHDGGTNAEDPGVILFNPALPADEYEVPGESNHYHYPQGSSMAAGVGAAGYDQPYVEACRLVRKDGFFRVGQDFRLEGINTFPQDYLISSQQVMDYSGYVTGSVSSYSTAAIGVGNNYYNDPSAPVITPPLRTGIDGTPSPALTFDYTYLPPSFGGVSQQLRSRGIYIDYLSSDLRTVIDCLDAGGSAESCKSGDVELDGRIGSVNTLEIIPFFEVQTTFLNDWYRPIERTTDFTVTDDLIENVPYSRGLAEIGISGLGDDPVTATANRGVTGLTGTSPILAGSENMTGEIRVIVHAGTASHPGGRIITGTLESVVPGFDESNVDVTATDAICSFAATTGSRFTCFLPAGSSPKMILGNLESSNKDFYVCSSHQTELAVDDPKSIAGSTKSIDMAGAVEGETDYLIRLTQDYAVCGGDIIPGG